MLTIDLRETFEGDTVEIWLDGEKVRVEHDVRTRMQIGLARSLQLELPRPRCRVEVRLPARGAHAAIEIDSARTPHLGVALDRIGVLTLHPSAEAFGYA